MTHSFRCEAFSASDLYFFLEFESAQPHRHDTPRPFPPANYFQQRVSTVAGVLDTFGHVRWPFFAFRFEQRCAL